MNIHQIWENEQWEHFSEKGDNFSTNSHLSINRAGIPRKVSIFRAFELCPLALFP